MIYFDGFRFMVLQVKSSVLLGFLYTIYFGEGAKKIVLESLLSWLLYARQYLYS